MPLLALYKTKRSRKSRGDGPHVQLDGGQACQSQEDQSQNLQSQEGGLDVLQAAVKFIERNREKLPTKQYSKGASHSALIKNGLARKALEKAHRFVDFASQTGQDLVRIVFSNYGRGHNSANARHMLPSQDKPQLFKFFRSWSFQI